MQWNHNLVFLSKIHNTLTGRKWLTHINTSHSMQQYHHTFCNPNPVTHLCYNWRIKDQLDVTFILFHFLCTQHVSDINISIISSLWLCCWITTSVVLFLVHCALENWCGWVWVVSMLLASVCNTNTTQPSRTKSPTHNEPRTKQPMW
jgi:hypothetical protein